MNSEWILRRFLQAVERTLNVTFKDLWEEHKAKANEHETHSWEKGYHQGVSDGFMLARLIIGMLPCMTKGYLGEKK